MGVRWKFAFAGGVLGSLAGLAAVHGVWTRNADWLILLALVLAGAAVAARATPRTAFRNAVALGFAALYGSRLVLSLLFDTYLANNPEVAASYRALPADFPAAPRTLSLISGFLVAAIGAAMCGGVAWLSTRRQEH